MELRYDLLLNPTVLICTLLLVIIPLLVLLLNQYLHKTSDPPWKQHIEEENKETINSEEAED